MNCVICDKETFRAYGQDNIPCCLDCENTGKLKMYLSCPFFNECRADQINCQCINDIKQSQSSPHPGGRPRKPASEKYQQVPLKLPPTLINWLAHNTDNRNGFIVEAIAEKIERIER